MHGVPKKLNLKPFLGSTLDGVDPLENIVYFNFFRPKGLARKVKGRELQIGVEGMWELRNGQGLILSRGEPMPVATGPTYPLGRKVIGSEVRAPRSFVLHFETGEQLEVFDSCSDVESFSIPQQGVYV